jgi:hypothetical protein
MIDLPQVSNRHLNDDLRGKLRHSLMKTQLFSLNFCETSTRVICGESLFSRIFHRVFHLWIFILTRLQG